MEPNKAVLADIAKKYLSVDTLDCQKSDRLDFHDLAVWSVKHALEAAFQAGCDAAEDRGIAWQDQLLPQAQNKCGMELALAGRIVFREVLAAMQSAEEMGGPEKAEYMDLMVAIIREASDRISCLRLPCI